jgi:glycosyltransferase involved in cell wall biosynthesis
MSRIAPPCPEALARVPETVVEEELPLVTVVTPTLNQGQFVEATLRSVLGQTYPRIEHIVIDGGSSDGTISVLRRYERAHGLHWRSEPDRGMYDAVNKGLAMANGAIVSYLNSDDLLLPWGVEAAVRHLLSHPATGLVFGDAIRIDDETGDASLFVQPPFRPDYLETIGSFAQPATFWLRTVHESVGLFDPDLQFAGDLDFYLRVAERFRITRMNEFLAVMRLHTLMKTRALAARSMAENATVRARYASAHSTVAIAAIRARSWAARRRLWLAFAWGAMRRNPDDDSPWGRFIREGDIRVSLGRLAVAQLPVLGLRVPRVAETRVKWLAVPVPPFTPSAADEAEAG